MALQVWLPLNGNLNNYGLSNVNVINYNATVDSSGKIGSCYSFGTGSSYLTIPNTAMTGFTDECSVAFWLNIISWNTAWSTFFQAGRGGTPWNNYIFGFLRDNTESRCVFAITNASNTTSSNSYPTSSLDINTWYHIALTYKTGKVSIYINGILDHEYSTSIVPDFSHITNISVAKCNNATSYQSNCKINDLRIYDNCLSAKEIKEISQALVLHYKLDSVKNNILPPGIELYDSIQGDGNSTIYTLIPYDSTKSTYKIKCKFSQPANVSSWDSVFAAYTDENSKTIRIIRGNSNNLMYMYYNNKAGSGNPVVFNTSNANIKEVTITSTNVVCIENGTTDTHSFGAPSGTDTQSTFNLIRNSKSVIYYWTIWDGDVMLGNFLPATFYGEPGMWDTVTKKFFPNDGTGTFILGNKITIKEYEYLQCDTSSYIKSGVFPTTSTNFEMKYATNNLSTENVLFGCSTAVGYASGNNYSLDILTSGSLFYTFRSSTSYSAGYTVTANSPFVAKLWGSTFSVNGITKPANRLSSPPNLEIYLFARNVNNAIHSSYPPRVGKIYYCKFWESDNLIRDFIPVSYNGTLGLFDKVELKFYPNAGSGTFTAGTLVSEIVEDCSGYGHDGTVINEVLTVDGSPKYDKHTQFSTTSYIKCTSPTAEVRSASFWLKIPSIPTTSQSLYQIVFVDYKSKLGFCIGRSNYFTTSVGGTDYYSARYSTTPITVDNWHHIVVVNTGTSYTSMTRNVYIDGVLQTPLTTTDYWNYDVDELQIGRRSTANNYTTNEISDLRLYATALSDDDVMHLYKTSASIDNLAGFHTFEIEEKNHTPSIQKNGETIANNFIEKTNNDYLYLPSGVGVPITDATYAEGDVIIAKTVIRYATGGSTRDLMGLNVSGNAYWGVTSAGAWEPHGTFTYTNSNITVKNTVIYNKSIVSGEAWGHYSVGMLCSGNSTYSHSTRNKYIYHVSLYKNGVLIKDLYPMKDESYCGLYDIVSNTFYPCNNTTGVLGSDANSPVLSIYNDKIETSNIIEY